MCRLQAIWYLRECTHPRAVTSNKSYREQSVNIFIVPAGKMFFHAHNIGPVSSTFFALDQKDTITFF